MSTKRTCLIKGLENCECRFSENEKKCAKLFYRCPDINTKTYYDRAIKRFLTIEKDIVATKEDNARTKFTIIEKRKPNCDGILSKTDRKNKSEKKANVNEDFLCRCYYSCYTGQCKKSKKNCDRKFTKPSGEFQIIDYQIPPLAERCGKVDLVIRDENKLYLTEVKPPEGNEETLLRMISEILTYTSTLKDNEYFHKYVEKTHKMQVNKNNIFPAIMFFEGSPQETEWNDCCKDKKKKVWCKEILDIIERNEIKLFVCEAENKTKIKQITAKN